MGVWGGDTGKCYSCRDGGRKDVGVKEVVHKEENDKVSKAFPVLCMHFKSPVRSHLLFSILRITAYQND